MTRLITLLFTTLLLLANCQVLAYDSLDYQRRGDRWEGIQPRKVGGFDLELLSALVDYSESQSGFPAAYKLLFYMTTPAEINLTVSELIPKQYYVMDKVKEKETWREGFNSYQWPTETVIKPLQLTMKQLGVVARVNREANRPAELVAPVVFYHSQPPTRINRYRFVFKVGGTANLNYAVYQGGNQKPLLEKQLGKKIGGEPFMITWDSSQAPAGEYELVVDGYLLQNNSKLHQAVRFYHQPEIKGNF
jgi:hypothetical protein